MINLFLFGFELQPDELCSQCVNAAVAVPSAPHSCLPNLCLTPCTHPIPGPPCITPATNALHCAKLYSRLFYYVDA